MGPLCTFRFYLGSTYGRKCVSCRSLQGFTPPPIPWSCTIRVTNIGERHLVPHTTFLRYTLRSDVLKSVFEKEFRVNILKVLFYL